MRQIIAIVVAVIIASPGLAAAGGPLLEAARHATAAAAVTAAVAQSQDEERERSMARTWGGVGLIVAGLVVPIGVKKEAFGQSRTEYHPGGVLVAAGLVGAGVLLATIWADVPAQPSIGLTIAPDRVQVGKTFGW